MFSRNVFTCGRDSLVRCFGANVDARAEEARTIEHHSEPVTTILATGSSLFTGSEDRSVVMFRSDSMLFQATVTRCTLPIRQLALQPMAEDQMLGVVSDELTIKLVSVATGKCHYLSGLKYPPASISFHPNGQMLVALSCHGTLASWDLSSLEEGSYNSHKTSLDRVGPSSRPELNEGCIIAYHPLGKMVALPAIAAGEIQLLRSPELTPYKTLSGGHSAPVKICRWTPNGQFLATAASDASLVVWRAEDWTICAALKHTATITWLDWSPTTNLLTLADENGSVTFLDAIVLKNSFRASDWARVTYSFAHKLDEMFGEQDELAVSDSPSQGATPMEIDSDVDIMSDPAAPAYKPMAAVAVVEVQPSFQPCATLVEGSAHQFLAFNNIGYITVFLTQSDPIYSVTFHNKEQLKDYSFSDARLFTIASLDPLGAMFAMHALAADTDDYADDDDFVIPAGAKAQPAVLFYRPHGSWDINNSWEAKLPKGEDFQTAVTTSHGPIITTTLGFVRFFSCTGIQTYMCMAPSPTMLSIATDYKELVLHVYHTSAERSQLRLAYSLYSVSAHQTIASGPLTLAPEATLEWVGFSDEGLPACSDSNGLVQVLAHPHQPERALWHPVASLDLAKHAPYGLAAGYLYCIDTSAPSWITSPRAEQVPWKVPAMETSQGEAEVEGQLMAQWVMRDLSLNTSVSAKSSQALVEDRLLLQLFKKACQDGTSLRYSLELAALLNRPSSLQSAIKIANSLNHPTLSERLERLIQVTPATITMLTTPDASLALSF
ncbi:DNA polymerase alpha accessory factor Mcl1, variant 2 [Entomophthora muscae]|uniref:DNA polymerase alpha accessory factor Mcl1, variant 2 n=1 Tax=Entomophthora muscae TaxID=34485 RepID=A0ACC2SSV3_9FUNG|nr:DNA polymerase alpha accessory factor Mcl1, variant 2 [Entomophthora muscae]